ncbi:MAG: 23S rRNA (pseudouridine(1915)-N(3))-methyltransferase RlmH [Peptoniphilaceae bacterium]|nr:23S rRNA (pseudouridine(1915)-N(3))-methyltransferase RlmH [Peptoniphilaceae bacterium]MDY6018433.1 23S rRNA (pseudouridine(1915)-N(3))-methyltransferase RlmH [Anaerococcus sp.]
MNIRIIGVGKIKEKYFTSAINEYLKRLTPYCKLQLIEVKDEPASESLSEKELEIVKRKEGERILNNIKEEDFVVSLEILGKQMTSEKFAEFISAEMDTGFGRNMVFVIGGSNGLSKEVSTRSNYKLSFSKMTFPHQLMRLVLIEQIYRAFRIINNHPYHK